MDLTLSRDSGVKCCLMCRSSTFSPPRLSETGYWNTVPRCSTISFCLTFPLPFSSRAWNNFLFSTALSFSWARKPLAKTGKLSDPKFSKAAEGHGQRLDLVRYHRTHLSNKKTTTNTSFSSYLFFSRESKLSTRTRPLFHDLVMTADQPNLPSPRKAKNQSILDDGYRSNISMREWDGWRFSSPPPSPSLAPFANKRARALSWFSKPFWRTHANRDNRVLSPVPTYRPFSSSVRPVNATSRLNSPSSVHISTQMLSRNTRGIF